MTHGIYKSVRRKNFLYRKYVKNSTNENKTIYFAYRNSLNSIIRKAKKAHIARKFEEAKNKPKNTWKYINELLSREKPKTDIKYIIQENTKYEDPEDIANLFNNFFCKYWSNDGIKDPSSPKEYVSILR